MKIESALISVTVLYLKFFVVYMAYHFSKTWSATSKSSDKLGLAEKVRFYTSGVGICIVVAIGISVLYVVPGEGRFVVADKTNYTAGVIAFLVLVIPVCIGLTEGFDVSDRKAAEWRATADHSSEGEF